MCKNFNNMEDTPALVIHNDTYGKIIITEVKTNKVYEINEIMFNKIVNQVPFRNGDIKPLLENSIYTGFYDDDNVFHNNFNIINIEIENDIELLKKYLIYTNEQEDFLKSREISNRINFLKTKLLS